MSLITWLVVSGMGVTALCFLPLFFLAAAAQLAVESVFAGLMGPKELLLVGFFAVAALFR